MDKINLEKLIVDFFRGAELISYDEKKEIMRKVRGRKFSMLPLGAIIRAALREQGYEVRDNALVPIERKFKSGDWIVYNEQNVGQIATANADGYVIFGYGYIPFFCEKYMRLWTINDAKKGDILVDKGGCIGCFDKPNGNNMWYSSSYIGSSSNIFFEHGGSHWNIGTYPATKEQQVLFHKVKEEEVGKYKRDYKITISADNEDIPLWCVNYKGDLKKPTKEDYKVIYSMVEEIYNKLSKIVKEGE